MPAKPTWKIPENVEEFLQDEDGIWEDDRWSPLLLMAVTHVENEAKAIPVAWELHFEPAEDYFAAANDRLMDLDFRPDGHGWGEFIMQAIRKSDPKLAKKLHLDCDPSECMIWVECKEDFRKLVESTWHLDF